jgi:hypothetical protein
MEGSLRRPAFRAWTALVDGWFAAPGSVLMKAVVNIVLLFEA